MRRKKRLLLLLFLLLITVLVHALLPRQPQKLDYHLITLNPRKVEIRPVVLNIQSTSGLTFTEVVRKYNPCAAINGTFYDSNFRPLGDVVCDGKLQIIGRYPNAFAVTHQGNVEFVRRKGSTFDWRGYQCALAAGPRLIHDGDVRIDAAADGFLRLDPKAKASRSGIGLTDKGKLLLVVCETPVTMLQFAHLMRRLGAVEAMNLDGGPACGLYADGKTIVSARLRMTNLLLVYKRH